MRLFIQSVLEHPENREKLPDIREQGTGGREQGAVNKSDSQPSIPGLRSFSSDTLAKQLWREGLIIVYRLLFVLKLEASDDPARAFSFASTSLWRNSFSPTMALADYARQVISDGIETGHLLEGGLTAMFRMFAEGLECTELNVKPLGGALFGVDATPVLSQLAWGERAVAHLLDQLLWTAQKRGSQARQRVHYGPLDVEDLGRVYEALLELEPGIATEPMCRLRRQKLEVVVPMAQGDKYRPVGLGNAVAIELDEDEEEDEEETPKRSKKTKVEWIEEIPPGQFYLRVGLGRKSSGSYYTPHSFVRFLVQETLGPQVEERSPKEDPNPLEILKLKVLDPAMGSGHFLVEACRFLGDKLYEACRLCDERASAAEARVEKAKSTEANVAALAEAQEYWRRVIDLPDPDDKLMKYLPSSAPEGQESGLSQQEALALCRRLVAVHCLYGVDKNPLAVELAKLSLWLESHAEGLPLTFLDHRLVVGDSLTGPFFEHLLTYPGTQQELDPLLYRGIREKFTQAMGNALAHVKSLEASVGINLSDITAKAAAKEKLDRALAPFKVVAAAWSGGVMLGNCDDVAYGRLVEAVGETGDLPEDLAALETSEAVSLRRMIAKGLGVKQIAPDRNAVLAQLSESHNYSEDIPIPALPYNFAFSEVFYPDGHLTDQQGFNAVIGNPPWDRMEIDPQDYFCQYDLQLLDEEDTRKRDEMIAQLCEDSDCLNGWKYICENHEGESRLSSHLYNHQVVQVDGKFTIGRPDSYKFFVERFFQLTATDRFLSWIVPSSFHSNEGSTGVRLLYLNQTKIYFCYSFENKNKIFDIDSRFKFDLLLAQKSKRVTEAFRAAFYIHAIELVFDQDGLPNREIRLDIESIELTGGKHRTFIEVQNQIGLDLIVTQFRNQVTDWGSHLEDSGIKTAFGVEIHRNPKFNNLIEEPCRTEEIYKNFAEKGWPLLPIHAGKSIFQYTDHWETYCSHYVLAAAACSTRHWKNSVPFYRFAFRMKAASNNERSMISVVLTPGFVCEQTLAVETQPYERPNANSLLTLAIANSYQFDWQVRQRITTSLSNYILAPIPLPNIQNITIFLVHSALRLTCNHSGYETLWREQVGNEWRESGKSPFTWPVLATDDERWAVRAAIDAIVAQAYGLTRDQYTHVLSTFSHKSYPNAPHLCLAAFDELTAIGLAAFTRKHDPYHDIPLNESLPKPVIDLPLPATTTEPQQGSLDLGALS